MLSVSHLLPLGLSRFHCNLPYSELWSSATFAPRYHGLNRAPHVCPHRASLPGKAHYHQVTYISIQSDEERKGLVTWNLLNSEKDMRRIKERDCLIQFLDSYNKQAQFAENALYISRHESDCVHAFVRNAILVHCISVLCFMFPAHMYFIHSCKLMSALCVLWALNWAVPREAEHVTFELLEPRTWNINNILHPRCYHAIFH